MSRNLKQLFQSEINSRICLLIINSQGKKITQKELAILERDTNYINKNYYNRLRNENSLRIKRRIEENPKYKPEPNYKQMNKKLNDLLKASLIKRDHINKLKPNSPYYYEFNFDKLIFLLITYPEFKLSRTFNWIKENNFDNKYIRDLKLQIKIDFILPYFRELLKIDKEFREICVVEIEEGIYTCNEITSKNFEMLSDLTLFGILEKIDHCISESFNKELIRKLIPNLSKKEDVMNIIQKSIYFPLIQYYLFEIFTCWGDKLICLSSFVNKQDAMANKIALDVQKKIINSFSFLK